ncbi:MAG TPA: hypothetical protein PKJ08_06690 [Candidatus Cloacimonadota bacterium]|nr:hypothetical protein [Candidatus Cloacimonadota bacterium]
MGTQQILMIVISVIIVGSAIVVGLTMMNAPAQNSLRQQVVYELQFFASQVLAFKRTPTSMGGGLGNIFDKNQLGNYLGFTDNVYTNQNATYTLVEYKDNIAEISAQNPENTLNILMKVDVTKTSTDAITFEELE